MYNQKFKLFGICASMATQKPVKNAKNPQQGIKNPKKTPNSQMTSVAPLSGPPPRFPPVAVSATL
jgi:hypothetical protein